ncbi:MAG: gamma-glutamyl-gamma-aminobutyrate hydrolase family protein [Gemmataceae bacterium]|nr:gamma-glutamyl-gamma-aminobutyrate hydrolase family protein [Gemmataceae bacterium]
MTMPHPTRPWIAINADLVPAGKTTCAYARLNVGYFDAILNAGGLPFILPPLGKEAEIDALLDRADGVVLSGGLDMDPRRHGLPSHAAVQPMAQRRDDNDRLLVRRIIERKIPVLGIGVGMQQLNLACGGGLYMHLPEDQPRAMPHRDATGGPHRHAVLLEPGTRMEEIYGAGEIRVNSTHHQAVRVVGPNLRVGARAPDGIIEAIEGADSDWYCVGVQWHPESESASALDMQLFESFIQACLRKSQSLELAA